MGYKSMLRDRMPLMMSLALTYCKAKSRWIDYAYDKHIKRCPKNEKSIQVKRILGLKKKELYEHVDEYFFLSMAIYGYKDKKKLPDLQKSRLYYTFAESIIWNELNNDDREYWKIITGWVNWFAVMYQYIENDYQISLKTGRSLDKIKDDLMCKYSIDEHAMNYLIKCFEKECISQTCRR